LRAELHNFNLIERLVLLAFLFIPLKFFTIKLGSISLSFSRIIILVLLPIAFFYILREISKKNSVKINSIYFNNYSILLFIYATFSYLVAIISYNDLDFSNRVHLSSLSFFESVFLLPFIFFVLVPSTTKQLAIFKSIFKYLKIFIYLSVLQLFLDLIGFPISYESIGEPSPENRSNILGFEILRISSFFGEPRDLATLIVPIFFISCIIENRKIRFSEILLILFIGVATISSSFIVAILLSVLIYGIFSSLLVRLLIFPIIFSLSALYFLNIELVQDFAVNNISQRFDIVFQLLNPEIIGALANISPEFKDQISDVSLVGYVFNGEFVQLTGIFGHGLGSGHFAIDKMAFNHFGIQNDGILYGSRWIFYTLVLELGVIGIILFYLMLRNIYKKNSQRIKSYKLYILIFIATSLFSSAYFFLFLSIYLSIRSNALKIFKYSSPRRIYNK